MIALSPLTAYSSTPLFSMPNATMTDGGSSDINDLYTNGDADIKRRKNPSHLSTAKQKEQKQQESAMNTQQFWFAIGSILAITAGLYGVRRVTNGGRRQVWTELFDKIKTHIKSKESIYSNSDNNNPDYEHKLKADTHFITEGALGVVEQELGWFKMTMLYLSLAWNHNTPKGKQQVSDLVKLITQGKIYKYYSKLASEQRLPSQNPAMLQEYKDTVAEIEALKKKNRKNNI